jgi:alanine racemase
MNMVRVGIALFGYETPELKPAMGLKARIVHLQTLEPGEGVSYGQTFINQSEHALKIATLPLGYADGISRGLSNQIEGFCQGTRVKQVGTISMDQLMVDVTGVPDAQIGDVVTLLGGDITLEDWSQIIHTIPYELMCALRVRLPKVAVRL